MTYFKRKLYSSLKAHQCPICSKTLTNQLHCPNKEHLFLFEISNNNRISSIKFSINNKISAPYIYLDFIFNETIIYLTNNKQIKLNYLISPKFNDLQLIQHLIDKVNILQ